MTKILCSADWHILLHKKKVPYTWQMGRFKSMFAKLLELEHDCDVHIIAGDIFDKKPEPDEICLFLSYINSVTIPRSEERRVGKECRSRGSQYH